MRAPMEQRYNGQRDGVQVRKREQEVANMRDASYDAKDAARNARLRVK